MAGPARDDGGVRLRRALPVTGAARWPGPAAVALLAGILLAGCASGAPKDGGAGGGAGQAVAGTNGGTAGTGSASASPGKAVGGSSNSVNNRPDATVTPTAAGSSPGIGSGCTRWPAGSTSTTLLITQASNGHRYCVHAGQAVQVFLTGRLSPKDGAEPPRLTGTGLVPASFGRVHLLRSPAAAYQAVRPGRAGGDGYGQAVLTVVRLPCHSVQPAQTAPADGTDGALGTSSPGRSGAPGRANAMEMAYTGGAPVGAQCALQQALRVTVIVA